VSTRKEPIMRRLTVVFLLALGLFSAPALRAAADDRPAPRPDPSLETQLRALIAGFEGTVALHARNLDTDAEVGIDPDRRVRTASTIKLPIAGAVAELVAAGKARWDERLTITDDTKVSGSGVLAEFGDGETISLRDAMVLMIVVSDNTATNLILDRVGADAVNDHLDRLGLAATRSMRKIRGDGSRLKAATGWSRAGLLPENQRFGIGSSTPREMTTLLGLLASGKVVDGASSGDLLAILERQQYKDGIGRHAGDLRVASKSGALDALRSDVGIVWTPHGRIAIAVTVDDMPGIDYSPDNVGNRLISQLAQRIIADLR
jgi:beta-lactamase class A